MIRQVLRNSAAVFVSFLFLFSCSKNNNNPYGSNNNPGNPSSSSITITDMKFVAGSLTVKSGTTITWTNNDDATHTVTADDASFTSGDLKKGDKYTRTFSSAGTFNYHCKYHAMMTGSIVVNQ